MQQRSYKLAFLFGLGGALVGGMVAAGYLLPIPGLVRPWPGLPAAAFSSALCLVAGGLALLVAARRPSKLATGTTSGLGIAIAVCGALAGAERILGVDLGIDAPGLHGALGVTGAAPGRISPVACLAFLLLGVGLAALPLVHGRRAGIVLTVVATACAAIGATAAAGYLLHVEFLVSWPSSTPLSPQTAFGLLLLGLGLCSMLMSRAKAERRDGPVDEERAIQLTAVWTLSLIAVVAGCATFALAQYEYRQVVRDDLARTLRERRLFLEYAIHEHLDQLNIAARAFAAEARPGNRVATARLQAVADELIHTGFSGWRLETPAGIVASAGTFVEQPAMALALIGRFRTELLLGDGYFLRTRIPLRENGRHVGDIVAEERFPELTRLKLEADSWGETGEMALCVAASGLMDCSPLRTHPEAARYARRFNGQPLPMSLALDQETGIAETLDYRQHRVLAAYGPVGFTGMGMVIKIDAAEINRPLGRRFGAAALLLLGLVAAGAGLMRRRLRPLTRALVDAREEARRAGAQFAAAAESSLDGCFIMEAVRDARQQVVDFRVRYLNPSGEVMVRRASEDVVDRTLQEILPPAQADYFIGRYRAIVATGQSLDEEFRTESGDAGSRWIAHQAVRLGDGVSITARDITRVKTVERQLRERAENDVLTGLPNRTIFFDRLGRALGEARRAGTGVAVLFLDVDRFKQVNDTHGHPVGDAVLCEFAARLRAAVRSSDTIARLGGDEFAIILPDLGEIAHAERVAAGILAAIRVKFVVEGLRLDIGTSIGVAYSHGGHETPELLVGRADRKLYQAKAEGRGRYSAAAGRRAA